MKFFSKGFGFFDLLVICSFFYVFLFVSFDTYSDIIGHVTFLYKYLLGQETYLTSTLYSFVVYVFSGFKTDFNFLVFSSVFVLTVSNFVKYLLMKNIFVSEFCGTKSCAYIVRLSSLFSLSLCFVFSIPFLWFFKHYYYLGNLPANIWHNSTSIFTMPFVLMLFWLSAKQIDEFSKKRLYAILVLIALNAVAKPSFLLVYVVAYPVLMFLKHKFNKTFLVNMIPLSLAGVLLFSVYMFIYQTNHSSAYDNSSITINVLEFINVYYYNNQNVWMSIVVLSIALVGSFLFPIVTLLRNKSMLQTSQVRFALLCTTIGVLMAVFVNETGEKAWHGNFIWQAIMCSFVFFFAVAFELLKKIISTPGWYRVFFVELFVYSLHFISGVYYIIYMFQTNKIV